MNAVVKYIANYLVVLESEPLSEKSICLPFLFFFSIVDIFYDNLFGLCYLPTVYFLFLVPG